MLSDNEWKCNEHAPQFKCEVPVRVGDVIYFGTSIKGANISHPNAFPPFLTQQRIPIRTAHGPLTPSESALLLGFVSTSLSKSVTTGLPVSVAERLVEHDRELWNTMVDSFILRKEYTGEASQLQVDMESFCDGLKKIDVADPLAPAENQIADYFFSECSSSAPKAIEPRHIQVMSSALAPAIATRSNLKGEFYVSESFAFVAASTASIERGAAAMHNTFGDESRWSLAEWEASSICTAGSALPTIHYLTLRSQPWRWLRVLPPDTIEAAQYDIVLADGIRQVKVAVPVRAEGTISFASLQYLYAADVDRLRWGQRSTEVSWDSSVELTGTAKSACDPR